MVICSHNVDTVQLSEIVLLANRRIYRKYKLIDALQTLSESK